MEIPIQVKTNNINQLFNSDEAQAHSSAPEAQPTIRWGVSESSYQNIF
jgi:hypothetical protein